MSSKLTKNFSSSELECKCGCHECKMDQRLLDALQQIRDMCGFPLHITSGFRCAAHNIAIKGAARSQHTLGKAVDIAIDNMPYETFGKLLAAIFRTPTVKGCGFGHTFVHIDVRDGDQRVSWTY